ncbi:MAG: ATP-binding protein [Thiobacillaceae bacterium]
MPDNVRDACPGGAIEITLRRAGDQVELRICDRGPGFPEVIKARLFEPFHTTKRGGSVLGLACCLASVEAHGGESALGDGPGGEVIVRLPLLPRSFLPDSTATG